MCRTAVVAQPGARRKRYTPGVSERDSPSQHPRAALAAAIAHAEHQDAQARRAERARQDGADASGPDVPEPVPPRVNDLVGVAGWFVAILISLGGTALSAWLAQLIGGAPGTPTAELVFHGGAIVCTVGGIAAGHALRRKQLQKIAQLSRPPQLPPPGGASTGGAPVVVPALKDDDER